MDDKEKDYFVPEQLDDDDFEKEKLETKKMKKNKSKISNDEEKKFDKKKLFNILAVILVVAFIVFEIVWYAIYGKLWTFTSNGKKASEPEQAAKDFCTYLNNGDWKKVNESMDLKGYYILGGVLKDTSDYPKFDVAYKNLEEDENYNSYLKSVETLQNIDKEKLNEVEKIKIDLKSIDYCNKIQGTDTLYKLRVTFDYIYNGERDSVTNVIFISNASGEYKIVYGEWLETVLNYYQSVYVLNSNYSY